MPKNKAINTPFLNFLENHPHLFTLLKLIFNFKDEISKFDYNGT